jgi:SAM-dependent methyltransferase
MTDAVPRRGSYAELAGEYYDRTRHPTCASFRAASAILLRRALGEVSDGPAVEVGAGDSLFAELRGERLGDLLITDANAEMLRHSERWEERGARLAVAPAEALPVESASVGELVASLADPYDDEPFWREAARVLAPAGRAVVTAPSWTWAARFRADEGPSNVAVFELRSGDRIAVPSLVRPVEAERELIERSGLRLVAVDHVSVEELPQPVAPKLGVLQPSDAVASVFVATRAD